MRGKIKYYTDENVSVSVVNGLRLRGIDVLSTKEAKMLGASDEEQVSYAKSNKRVIFTHDYDFLNLHSKGLKHNGIVYTPQNTAIGRIIRGLLLIHQILNPDEMANHIEYL